MNHEATHEEQYRSYIISKVLRNIAPRHVKITQCKFL